MSEDTKPRSKFDVSADDFVAFLDAVSPESKCPSCGWGTWTILSPVDDDVDAYRMVLIIKNTPKPKALPVLGLTCDQCGFVRLHTAGAVNRWIKKRDAEKAAEDTAEMPDDESEEDTAGMPDDE